MATFQDRLKELRAENGISQSLLAEKLGFSNGAIGNYESGARFPRQEDLCAIADYFNVEIDYLIGRSDERPEFSLEEQWVMKCYRNADPDTRLAIRTLLRRFDTRDTASAAG